MAGWKLRKDKAQAETPETTEEAAEETTDETTDETAMPQWDMPTADREDSPSFELPEPGFDPISFEGPGFNEPEFADMGKSHTGGVIALGSESEPIPLAPLPDFEVGEEVSFDDDDEDTEASTGIKDIIPAALIYPEPAAPTRPETDTDTASLDTVPEVAPFVVNTPAAPLAADLPHRLVMRVGRLSAAFELTKEVTVIGRPDSNLHYYPDIEVEMDDAVSRRHAEVLKSSDGQYYLMDSGSTNGTRLNGETLPANEERLLAHGDRIHLGERTEIIFE